MIGTVYSRSKAQGRLEVSREANTLVFAIYIGSMLISSMSVSGGEAERLKELVAAWKYFRTSGLEIQFLNSMEVRVTVQNDIIEVRAGEFVATIINLR